MKKKKLFIIYILAFVILGIALSVQFRSTLYYTEEQNRAYLGTEKLREQYKEQQEKIDRLTKSNSELEDKMNNYLKNSVGKNNNTVKQEIDNLTNELNRVRILAGLTDVTGDGVVVTMNDAPLEEGVDPNILLIHDSYIQKTLNELKKGGAESISINGERVVTNSVPICTGPTIKINLNKYAPPYEIKAIGDPDKLYNQLMESSIVNFLMTERKVYLKIEKVNNLKITKYTGPYINKVPDLEVLDK